MERTADSFPEPVPAAGAMVDEPGETNTRLSEGDTLMRGRRLYLRRRPGHHQHGRAMMAALARQEYQSMPYSTGCVQPTRR
jgi:hypothetical protein